MPHLLKALSLANLNEIQRNVLIFVREHTSPDGMLIYPLKDMGKSLGYSELEVQRALRNLEELNLVDYREGENPEDPNMILYKDEWLDSYSQNH
ncbi:MarR family transcriptional regulator [Desulfotomaculum sp. 1211_IL3151]|uniref:MarR family transcriptional regulator n=1 Tax=Desulfotomaculum sp. 1211_IL3151 TaxID=3084055 RepID=UPI002FDB00C6